MRVENPVDPWDPKSVGVFYPPRRMTDGSGNEDRLAEVLRSAASTMEPLRILARAAAEFTRARQATTLSDQQVHDEFGTALADLAATGRYAYARLQGLSFKLTVPPYDWDGLKETTRDELANEEVPPPDALVEAAMAEALDRTYAVAWALRGPVAYRMAQRPTLGWIAVSGEDDKPHRPVNMQAPDWEQYEIDVMLGAVRVATRFIVASSNNVSAPTQAFDARAVPIDPPLPKIDASSDVLLFLHGHSSGAEEALELIPQLLQAGREKGKDYTVVAFDLPNNGYSETFVGPTVAAEDATTFPHRITDAGLVGTPVLDFMDEFVVAFVNKLDQLHIDLHGLSFKDRITVFGGSLGGNLALRMGRRNPANSAWIAKAVVAWSPASVWKPMVQNELRRKGPEFCETEFRRPEDGASRAAFFNLVYDHVPWPAVIKQQPEYWYRDGWDAKNFQILLSRIGRREIYNENYRRWHWRVACEQLIFSHFDNTTHGDKTTPLWYSLNTVRTLLIAGEVDNYAYVGIYDGTKSLAAVMPAPGRLLLLKNSGHSIHFEHPRYLVYQIVRFLTARSMEIECVTRESGRLEAVGGTDRTDPANPRPFTLGRADSVAAIKRGDEFYVTDRRGGEVLVHSQNLGSESAEFLRTAADGKDENNLDALPDC